MQSVSPNSSDLLWKVKNSSGQWDSYDCAKCAIHALIQKRSAENRNPLAPLGSRASVDRLQRCFDQLSPNLHSASVPLSTLGTVALDPDLSVPRMSAAPTPMPPQGNVPAENPPPIVSGCVERWDAVLTPLKWTCFCITLIALVGQMIAVICYNGNPIPVDRFFLSHLPLIIIPVVTGVTFFMISLLQYLSSLERREKPSREIGCVHEWKEILSSLAWTGFCIGIIYTVTLLIGTVYFDGDYYQMEPFLSAHNYIALIGNTALVSAVVITLVQQAFDRSVLAEDYFLPH